MIARSASLVLALLGSLVTAEVLAAVTIELEAACGSDSSKVTLVLHTFDPDPSFRPDWVGYDIVRRSVADCGQDVRLNDAPYIRIAGQQARVTYDTPPTLRTTYEYRAVAVDSAHRPVSYLVAPGSKTAYASCPRGSSLLTHGRVVDGGWAFHLYPCPRSCYPRGFISDPADKELLRPYLGRDVEIYGEAGCGAMEGCSMQVAWFDPVVCGDPTPVSRTTWTRVKTLYR